MTTVNDLQPQLYLVTSSQGDFLDLRKRLSLGYSIKFLGFSEADYEALSLKEHDVFILDARTESTLKLKEWVAGVSSLIEHCSSVLILDQSNTLHIPLIETMQPTWVFTHDDWKAMSVEDIQRIDKKHIANKYRLSQSERLLKSKEQKLRVSLAKCNAIGKENKELIHLIETSSRLRQPELEEFLQNIWRNLPHIVEFFEFDQEQESALTHMSQLTVFGRPFIEKPTEQDPYAFEQCELLFRDSQTLSVLATAINLSRECYNGSGPQKLEGELIPELAIAFRCLWVWAEERGKFDIPAVAAKSILAREQFLVEPCLLARFTDWVAKGEDQQKISFVHASQLKPDMIVMNEVRSVSGLLLIASKTILTERLIDTLEQYDVTQGHHPTIAVLES